MTDATKSVSTGELALYGQYAPLVRRLGDACAALGRAQQEALQAYSASAEADGCTSNGGRTQHTEWIGGLGDRIAKVDYLLTEVYRDIAAESMERWRDRSRGDQTGEREPSGPQ